MKSDLPVCLQYIQALSLPALATIAAAIAYRQYRTAYDKLRLDIFDRRLVVYIATSKFAGKVIQQGYPDNEDFGPHWKARDQAAFLFGNDIEVFMKKMHDTAAKLRYFNQSIPAAQGEARQNLIDGNLESFTDLVKMNDEINSTFAKYMRFSNLQE